MNGEFLIAALVVLAFGGGMVLNRRNMASYRRHFSDLTHLTVDGISSPCITWDPDPFLMKVTMGQRGKNGPQLWQVVMTPSPLGGRTTLTLEREGMGTRMFAQLGFPDVEIGDIEFDAVFKIGASDASAARGVLRSPDMQAAVRRFFVDGAGLASVKMTPDKMHLVLARNGASAAEAREVMNASKKFWEAAHAHKDAEATQLELPSLVKENAPALGAAGGSPMAVSVSPPERDKAKR